MFRQSCGATAIEYGLIVGLVGVSLYLGLSVYYDALVALFDVIIAAMARLV
ncbi:Flp family type IVb pilin [Allorhizobium taibaishanense]|uniref:Flp pilus assembly pilin Flp n=1 Tax=Allorhizobium taibaishanense TaxID=887144 RepID=A0A7W6MVN3_9HYPH|nr:Flp family type IVb pilin [Allorhizobium taibaishanense]MBB4009318.1 Flp pilus assembly pilin Flp [Allorhizobium taibaishanense]